MYKIFKITYNDGGWHSGSLPHAFYIAKSEEEVIANSKEYRDFLECKNARGGDIWIREETGLEPDFYFENISDFEISVSIRRK